MSAEAAKSTRRELWRASELLDRVERTLRDSGIALPELNKPSFDLNSILDRIDLTTSMGREIVDAAREMGELGGDAPIVRDAEMRVEIAEDAMTAVALILPPIAGGRSLTLDQCIETLREKHGIVRGIDRLALTRLLASAEKEPRRGKIARGDPAIAGRRAEWTVVWKPEESVPIEDAAGRIDFRELMTCRAVAPGDVLARLFPEDSGSSGIDLLGRPIPPPPPRPGRVLTAGLGTELRGKTIIATQAGEFRLDNDCLVVAPLRIVEGNVDFSVGNIDFPASVIVKGDILDGFTVKAAGDIEVHGSIHGATVTAAGSVRTHGGIISRGLGSVTAGGEITARFVENARIECRGEVRVQNSILHSEIDALGAVRVEGRPGTVAGGRIRTGAGLFCRTLGSVSCTTTSVAFGENFLAFRLLRRIEDGVRFFAGRFEEVDAALASIIAPVGEEKADDALHRSELTNRLLALRAKILTDLRRVMEARVTALAEANAAPRGEVAVQGETHAGVVLSSRGTTRTLEELHQRSRFRLKGDRIEVTPYD